MAAGNTKTEALPALKREPDSWMARCYRQSSSNGPSMRRPRLSDAVYHPLLADGTPAPLRQAA
jgi:hypothetical protein